MNTINDLLDKWQKERPYYNKFCRDGILVENIWEESNPKILFLLKETYESFIDIKGPMGPKGTSKVFWRKMKIWTYIITEYYSGRIPNYEKAIIIKESPNDSVAYVNIKKNAIKREKNKEAYSDNKDIFNYLRNDSEFLKEQIRLIKPDFIFCCNTFIFVKELFETLKLSDGLYKNEDYIFIDYLHPSNRKNYKSEIVNLSRIVEKIN